jgi:hypothetical protein
MTLHARWGTVKGVLLPLLLGALLACLCAWAGAQLNPPALARWTIQSNAQEPLKALLAMVGIRHLPLFLLAVALGNLAFRILRSTATPTVVCVTAPYLLYVIATGMADSIDAAEDVLSWVSYDPWYFVWPHFIAVPAGLIAASRMAARSKMRDAN